MLKFKYLWVVTSVIAVIGLAVGGYFFWQYQHTQSLLTNPTLASQLQTQDLLTKVGRLMELPAGETPTVATVSDISKLKNQPFFVHAQNGYKVIIYTKAKEAILYNPVADKIVTVAPLTVDSSLSVSPTPVVPTPTPKKTSK